ncbi:MAG TPA: Grx4 family monothiol glutaredoxin [Polyangiaceae bacterium]|nr:Grx4 family monothiol glutaredoxin [Polyangiaceae bacterium]
MDDATRQKIEQDVKGHPVVLFMKGTPQAPRCGFSATVAGILDELVGEYKSVDVLADSALRDGIKEYSDWPTIPQLYVKGQFVGGCDIVREMYESGELHETLGVKLDAVEPPRIEVSAAAAQALQEALAEASAEEPGGAHYIRVEVASDFQHALSVGTKKPRDVEVRVSAAGSGLALLLDRASARRAGGLSIDFVDGPDGPAFKLENPNEPPRVKSLSVKELRAKMQAEPGLKLFDVRAQKEREQALIEGSRLLDREAQQEIMKLDKATPLYFHCHHGGRSQQAAAFFLSHGFSNVYNVTGGIDAWSLEVDPKVPRY